MVHLFSILIVVLFYLLVYSPYLNINMNNMLYYLLFYYDIYIFLIINTYLDLFFMKGFFAKGSSLFYSRLLSFI